MDPERGLYNKNVGILKPHWRASRAMWRFAPHRGGPSGPRPRAQGVLRAPRANGARFARHQARKRFYLVFSVNINFGIIAERVIAFFSRLKCASACAFTMYVFAIEIRFDIAADWVVVLFSQ